MWPKYIDYYLHSGKEHNWYIGEEELGLSKEAIMEKFRHTGYEVHFRLQINEDGSNKVLKINDVDVSKLDIAI